MMDDVGCHRNDHPLESALDIAGLVVMSLDAPDRIVYFSTNHITACNCYI
jgi:hypothetical protein